MSEENKSLEDMEYMNTEEMMEEFHITKSKSYKPYKKFVKPRIGL